MPVDPLGYMYASEYACGGLQKETRTTQLPRSLVGHLILKMQISKSCPKVFFKKSLSVKG